ncbi:MAG: hypothetical protein ACP5GH_00260 [Nitrososphaeria archaeon]
MINAAGNGSLSIYRRIKGTSEPSEIHVKARYWRLEGSCGLPRINVFTVPK